MLRVDNGLATGLEAVGLCLEKYWVFGIYRLNVVVKQQMPLSVGMLVFVLMPPFTLTVLSSLLDGRLFSLFHAMSFSILHRERMDVSSVL